MDNLAALTNMNIAMAAMHRAIERHSYLPGIVTLTGPSGYGKSCAAAYVTTRMDAVYIQAKSTSTTKSLLLDMVKELGIAPEKTNAALTDQVAENLAMSDRPLIVDEFDYLVKKQFVEVIRDIFEASQAPIMLIGEEHMPERLKRWERFHNRILDHFKAEPASVEDALNLRDFYCDKVEVSDEIVKAILHATKGNVRRICVNLENVQAAGLGRGLHIMGMSDWDRQVNIGEAPKRKVAA